MLFECGEYYIRDNSTNGINETHVDIECLGRDLGVLFEGQSISIVI